MPDIRSTVPSSDPFAVLATELAALRRELDDLRGTVLARIPPPAVDTLATGTYVGDGTTNRTITLPFTPKIVFLNDSSNTAFYISGLPAGNTAGVKVTSAATATVDNVNAARPALTTNGFIVSGNAGTDTNVTGRTYSYVALT